MRVAEWMEANQGSGRGSYIWGRSVWLLQLPEVTYSTNDFPTSGVFITAGLKGSGMMLQKGLAASGKHFSLTWKQMKAWMSTTPLTSGSSITYFWMTSIEMLLHGQIPGTTISSRLGENLRKLHMICFFLVYLRMVLMASMGHVTMEKIRMSKMKWKEKRICPYMELTGKSWMMKH